MPPAAARPKLPRWRRITVWVLLVLATIILIISALEVWAKRQALETDSWVNTSTALLQNDQIRGALSVYLVNQLYQNVDVTAQLEQRLPGNTKKLAAPLAGALQQVLVNAANRLLQRPRVQALWQQANRTMHEKLMAVIEGNAKRVTVQGENVVLDLRPFLGQLEQQFGLQERLKGKLPANAGQITIMKADQLETIQTGAKWLRALSIFLVIAVFVLYALAVYLAKGRRRETLRAVAICLIVTGVILLAVRRITENHLIDALVKNDPAVPTVKEIWLIATSLLADLSWNLIGYGLVLLFAAWLAGPTRPASWIRRRLAPTFRDQPYLPFAIVGVLYLLVLLWGPTRAQREWIPALILAALLALGTEMYRRITVAEPTAAPPPARPTPAAP
jgi:NADH:ubiquinone oxidoreductase subunit 6 (subunit J)